MCAYTDRPITPLRSPETQARQIHLLHGSISPYTYVYVHSFYGGIFQLVVASAEAWRAASWEENKEDLSVLYNVRSAGHGARSAVPSA